MAKATNNGNLSCEVLSQFESVISFLFSIIDMRFKQYHTLKLLKTKKTSRRYFAWGPQKSLIMKTTLQSSVVLQNKVTQLHSVHAATQVMRASTCLSQALTAIMGHTTQTAYLWKDHNFPRWTAAIIRLESKSTNSQLTLTRVVCMEVVWNFWDISEIQVQVNDCSPSLY